MGRWLLFLERAEKLSKPLAWNDGYLRVMRANPGLIHACFVWPWILYCRTLRWVSVEILLGGQASD